MNTKKIIGLLIILGGLVLGYTGIKKVMNSDASVEVLGLEIDASNKSGKQQGYVFVGLAVVLFAGGIYTLNKK
ncbi:MAG: hypothetical protein NXI00_17545 [Cytophagales bacterium]|nr:hypothetical protein [Cytophagales bacterium]